MTDELPSVDFIRSMTDALAPEDAVSLWRNLILRDPRQWPYHEQLIFELRLGEDWQAIDALAEAHFDSYPLDLKLQVVDCIIASGRFDRAGQWLARVPAGLHRSRDVRLRAYALAFCRHDHAGACRIAAKLPGPEGRRLARRAATYEAITRRQDLRARTGYKVYVINLDRHAHRWNRTAGQLRTAEVVRVPGVPGSHLSEAAAGLLTGQVGLPQAKGSLGCYLSHLRAWEMIAAGDDDYGLVLEDDAQLLMPLPEELPPHLPRPFDLLFVNERTSPFRHSGARLTFVPAAASFRAKPSAWSSPGTDGYFVSRRGAERLLGIVTPGSLAGDIDWRLVALALGPAERRAIISRGGFYGEALGFHARMPRPARRLSCHVADPPLVKQFAGGTVRLFDNRLDGDRLREARDILRKRA